MQITHLDLDGAGCAIVLNWAMGPGEVHYAGYESLNKLIEELLPKATKDNPLWVTDLCPRKDSPVWLAILKAAEEGRFFLVDHHETALFVKTIPGSDKWARISSGVCCATMGLWVQFARITEYTTTPRLALPTQMTSVLGSPRYDVEVDFVRAVDAYDMWRLSSVHRARGEVLNRLVNFMGLEKFVADFTEFPGKDETEWSRTAAVLKENEMRFVSEAVAKYGRAELLFKDANKRPFLVIPLLGSHPCPQVGKAVLDAVPEAKYSVVVWGDQSMCSLYSRDDDETMDVSVLAREIGGGGHKHAAGGKTGMDDKTLTASIPEIIRKALSDRILFASLRASPEAPP